MTKPLQLAIIFILISLKSFCQKSDSSLYYYNIANKAIENKDLNFADSLYTKSLKFLNHPDTYYNRAMVRKANNNIVGYCSDIQSAANLGDTLSYDEFWKNCGTVDTVFFIQNGNVASNEIFGSYAIIKKGLYNQFQDFKKLNRKGVVLLQYFVDHNDTTYIGGTELNGTKSDSAFIESEAVHYVTKKIEYPQLAKEKGIQGTVIVAITINKAGDIENPTIIKGLPCGLNEAALNVFKGMPNWGPNLFNGRPIKRRMEIPIKFTLK